MNTTYEELIKMIPSFTEELTTKLQINPEELTQTELRFLCEKMRFKCIYLLNKRGLFELLNIPFVPEEVKNSNDSLASIKIIFTNIKNGEKTVFKSIRNALLSIGKRSYLVMVSLIEEETVVHYDGKLGVLSWGT